MRKRGFAISRMYYTHPTSGECYYLRMLLNCVKGATSYEHLRTVDGTEHDALLSSLLDPLEGLSMVNRRKLELGGAPDFQH